MSPISLQLGLYGPIIAPFRTHNSNNSCLIPAGHDLRGGSKHQPPHQKQRL